MAVSKAHKITLQATLTDIEKIDLKYDEATSKIVWHIHNVDGTVTVKTTDPMVITNSAITFAFDI